MVADLLACDKGRGRSCASGVLPFSFRRQAIGGTKRLAVQPVKEAVNTSDVIKADIQDRSRPSIPSFSIGISVCSAETIGDTRLPLGDRDLCNANREPLVTLRRASGLHRRSDGAPWHRCPSGMYHAARSPSRGNLRSHGTSRQLRPCRHHRSLNDLVWRLQVYLLFARSVLRPVLQRRKGQRLLQRRRHSIPQTLYAQTRSPETPYYGRLTSRVNRQEQDQPVGFAANTSRNCLMTYFQA